jgi:hypothetical protein
MTNTPQQIEFTSYSLNTYPPEPIEVTMVTPVFSVPTPTESLSENLLLVCDRDRRMGYLVSNNWLDLDRFKMAAGKPPEKNFFKEPPRDYPTVYRRLMKRHHMACATSAFKAVCLSPDIMPEVDVPRTETGNSESFSRTITEYIREAGIYQPVTSGISLDYLLVSHTAVINFVKKIWHPSVFGQNIGDKQLEVLQRIYDQPTSPYTSAHYDFDL